MQVNEQQLKDYFKPGAGALDGATVLGVLPFGEYPCDGSFEGVEISLRLRSGSLALLLLDTLDTEGAEIRLVIDDEQARRAAKDAAAFLLTGDKLGGCAELAEVLHSTVRPVTISELYAKQAAANPPCYIEKPRPVPPTYAEMCEKGIDRVGNAYGRR